MKKKVAATGAVVQPLRGRKRRCLGTVGVLASAVPGASPAATGCLKEVAEVQAAAAMAERCRILLAWKGDSRTIAGGYRARTPGKKRPGSASFTQPPQVAAGSAKRMWVAKTAAQKSFSSMIQVGAAALREAQLQEI